VAIPGTEIPDVTFPRGLDTSFDTDADNAHDNIVTSNEFLNRNPGSYMENDSGAYNFTAGNREVRGFGSGKKPCFSPLSFGRVLLHGNSETVVRDSDFGPGCLKFSCNDGTLTADAECVRPELGDPIAVGCQVTDDNNGCQNVKSCPLGQHVKSVTAACNLEFGSVTDTEFAQVPAGNVKVVRVSDPGSNGVCYVLGAAVASGTVRVAPQNPGVRSVNVACKEKDANGGDCHVRAVFTCE
jgi:hypothetical protein